MPGPERDVVARDDVRVLVALEADPVPGPVEERLAVALGLDRLAGRGVDRAAGDARRDGLHRGRLGVVQHPEQVPEALVRALGRVAAGHPQGPRDVRAVAAEDPADVEDDRLAGLDDPVGRLVVRRRRVRARRRRSRTVRRSWPSATSRSRTSRATSASVRPMSRPAAIDATTRSAAWAASRSRAISSASLTIRRSRRTGRRGLEPGARPEMRLEPQEMDGPQAVRDRDPRSGVARRRRDAAGDDGVRIVELAPGHDLDRRPQARPPPRRARAAGRR